jgi:DNA-binding CsgD family transcriptional regulator
MVLLKPALLTALGVLAVKLLNTLLVYHFFTFEYYLAFVAVIFLLGGFRLSSALARQSKKGEALVPVMVLATENEEHSQIKSIRYSLSNRELTVFKHLANGCSNKEIASNLGIELSTVKTHINNLYTKINCSNRKQAIEIWDKMVQKEVLF